MSKKGGKGRLCRGVESTRVIEIERFRGRMVELLMALPVLRLLVYFNERDSNAAFREFMVRYIECDLLTACDNVNVCSGDSATVPCCVVL